MNALARDLALLAFSSALVFPVQCRTRMDQAESEDGQDCSGPNLPRYGKSHPSLSTA